MAEVFDAHCHVGVLAGKYFGPEDLMRQMDELGIDRALVSPMDESDEMSVPDGNDLVAEATQRWGDRVVGFAYVDPTVNGRAEEELRRALDLGLSGLKLRPLATGFCASGRMVRGVVSCAAEAGLPIVVHSGSVMSPFLDKIGMLADDFPGTQFVVSFCKSRGNWGECVPYGQRHGNVMYDTADLSASMIGEVVGKLGADRLLFGSGTPFGSMRFELAKARSSVSGEEASRQVLWENALRVFGATARN
jgi:predicted TIM-barrel fold metal-dependent hydrolase